MQPGWGALAPPELDRTAGGNDRAVVRKVSEGVLDVMRDVTSFVLGLDPPANYRR